MVMCNLKYLAVRLYPTWQIREILAQNTFQGQNDLRVHFGLNAAAKIDSVEVVWLSGKKDVFTNVLPNQFYQITEGGAITTSRKSF